MASIDSDLAALRHAIDTCPIIDNHAHNLLRADKQHVYPLISCVTEAHGDALKDTPHSLAHMRAVKQLRELYGCDSTATWQDLLHKRAEILSADANELNRRCLAGIHTILIDDGIDDEHNVHSFAWHDQFTTGKTYRIVRIETLAANLMREMYEEGTLPLSAIDQLDSSTIWPVFLQAFENALADEIKDEAVAGFKSVVCYRTGLDVTIGDEMAIATAGQSAFRKYLKSCARGQYRIQHKGLNDCLVISACRLLAANYKQTSIAKPIQFHTGLGDSDMSLLKSNPAHMQPLIAAFPTVQFVILHSSYPYTREAGYLAAVYKNAFLDIGEIFPMVSIEGQVAAIKQAMELAPFSKLLWSTDGHHFPESYWLANKQFRHVLFRVFKDLLAEEVITIEEATRAIRDIMFENSNRIYYLQIKVDEHTGAGKAEPLLLMPARSSNNTQPSLPSNEIKQPSTAYNTQYLSSFLRTPYGKAASYFLIQWVDYLGTIRCRSFPLPSFVKLVNKRNRVGIARATLHILQDDSLTESSNTTGHMYAEPDLATLRPIYWKDLQGATTVMSSFKKIDGARLEECPRCILQNLSDRLREEHNIEILVGFELEITFLRSPASDTTFDVETAYPPIESTAAHAWNSLSGVQSQNMWPLVAKLVHELQSIGLPVEHFHSESGQGQYEFALPPLPLVAAVDVLYQTRQAIQMKAQRWGLRATFHPKALAGIGSGLHAHISLNHRPGREATQHKQDPPTNAPVNDDHTTNTEADAVNDDSTTKDPHTNGESTTTSTASKPQNQTSDNTSPAPREASFWSSVLSSLPSITAFTLPNDVSYARVTDNAWSGGSWVAWGTQNREVPLRRVDDPGYVDGRGRKPATERWEVRCLDGMGNMYLSLAAIVGAGMEGLIDGRAMEMRDCEVNPAKLSDEERAERGITTRMSRSLGESLNALGGSEVMKRVFGEQMINDYITVKKAERDKLEAMTPVARRVWLIERY